MRQAALELGEVAPDRVHDLVGDDVAAAALRRDDDRPLGPAGGGHGSGSGRGRRGGGGGELAPDGGPRGAARPGGGAGAGG